MTFGLNDEARLTDSEGIVALETTPLSSVIRLRLADLFRHQDGVACGLEEQAAQHDAVPRGERGTSGDTLKLRPRGNHNLHLVDAIAGEQRWQLVDDEIRGIERRHCAWELRHVQFHAVRGCRRARGR